MAHAGGRPTKYLPEMCQKVDEYLATCVDEETQRVKSEGDKSTSWQLGIKVNLPTIEDFSTFLDVHLDTIYAWDKEYPEFSESLDKIRKAQKAVVLKKGLSGEYNPLIAKLILSANHGMSEKTSVDHTTNGKDLPTPILTTLAKE